MNTSWISLECLHCKLASGNERPKLQPLVSLKQNTKAGRYFIAYNVAEKCPCYIVYHCNEEMFIGMQPLFLFTSHLHFCKSLEVLPYFTHNIVKWIHRVTGSKSACLSGLPSSLCWHPAIKRIGSEEGIWGGEGWVCGAGGGRQADKKARFQTGISRPP